MEIHALKIQFTEQDLAALALHALRDNDQLSDIQVRITPDAVVIAGVYRLMMRVSFETHWNVNVQAGKVAVTLRELRAGGFGAGILKGVLMSIIQAEAEREDGVDIKGETIIVDPDRLLAGRGMVVRTNLTCVQCETGTLVLVSERSV